MYDLLLVANALLFAVVTALYLRHPAASLVHPASHYLAFHGFVFVLRPVLARIYDYSFVYQLYRFTPEPGDRAIVLLGASLALVTFVAVALKVAPMPPRAPEPGEAEAARARLAGPLFAAALVLLPLALFAQAENWRRRSLDFTMMVVDPLTGVQANTQGSGWLTDSALLLAPLAVLAVWASRYRRWGWAALALFGVLQAGTGARGPIIYALVAAATLYLLERGRRWFDWRLVVLAVVGAWAFTTIVQDRGRAIREVFAAGDPSQQGAGVVGLAPLEGMDFANMEFFEFVVWAVPKRTGSWDYFANNLQVFTEPIPRVLWPGKPFGSPVQFFQLWDYGNPAGITLSVPGVGWISFGWFGIIVQASVFALIYGLLYARLVGRRADTGARLAFVLVAATSVTVLRDGTILTLLRSLPFYVGPFLLVAWFARWSAAPARGRGIAPQSVQAPPAERRRRLAAAASAPPRPRR